MKQKQLLSFLVCILMLSSCAAPTDSRACAQRRNTPGLLRRCGGNPPAAAGRLRFRRISGGDARELRAGSAQMPSGRRPYACRRTEPRVFGGNGCVRHPDCDICTDSACCQAYQTDAQLHARWGSEYVVLRARIDRAVRATDGLLITTAACPSKCCTTPVPAERLKMPPPCSRPPSRIWSA